MGIREIPTQEAVSCLLLRVLYRLPWTASGPTPSKFLDFPEILETGQVVTNRRANAKSKKLESLDGAVPCSFCSKPKRDSTADGPATGAELRQNLAVFSACLNVQQITRVKDGFGAKRQTEARQVLRDLDA